MDVLLLWRYLSATLLQQLVRKFNTMLRGVTQNGSMRRMLGFLDDFQSKVSGHARILVSKLGHVLRSSHRCCLMFGCAGDVHT